MFDFFRCIAKDSHEPEPINLNHAVHRRILNFLNEAISPSDLEYTKPLFIHDHEGVPIHEQFIIYITST